MHVSFMTFVFKYVQIVFFGKRNCRVYPIEEEELWSPKEAGVKIVFVRKISLIGHT